MSPVSAEPAITLHVTVVLPCRRTAAWQKEMLLNIECSDFVCLSVFTLDCDEVSQPPISHAFRWWRQFDLRSFRKKLPDGRSSEDSVDTDFVLDLGSSRVTTGVTIDTLVAICDEEKPDVVVWLVPPRPPEVLFRVARFGIWTLPNSCCETAGYRELVNRNPVTPCILTSLSIDPEDDCVLSTAFAPTDLLSLSRSLLAVRAKDQALLTTMLRRVHNDGEVPRCRSESKTGAGPCKAPGVAGLFWGLVRLYSRYALSLATRRFVYSQWQIAYRRGGDRLDQNGMTRFAPNHKGFWADPFVISWKGQTALFFEEMPAGEVQGNIVVADFRSGGAPGEPRTIIERDYHLSYPFLFEYEGELFMTPESAEANKVEAHRCVEFPLKWESYSVLLDGIKAYDPTLIEHDGRWWMFVSVQNNGNSSADELHLFHADNPFSEWVPHPLNPVNTDVRSARPGGALYRKDGELFRPAQDCSVRYGYALSIQKILRMTEKDYEEEEVCRILPDWSPGAWGTHTVNQGAGIIVYDYIARRRK